MVLVRLIVEIIWKSLFYDEAGQCEIICDVAKTVKNLFYVLRFFFLKYPLHHRRRVNAAGHELGKVFDFVLEHHAFPEFFQRLERAAFERQLLKICVVAAEELVVKSSYYTNALNRSSAQHFCDELDKKLKVLAPIIMF